MTATVLNLFAQFRPAWQAEAPFILTPLGHRWTYRDLDDATRALSSALRACGVAPGDRVVALVERSEWSIFLYLACARAAAIYVPLNNRLTAAELTPVLAQVEPALIVCDPGRADAVRALLPAKEPRVRTLGPEGDGTLLAAASAAGEEVVQVSNDHCAAIIFTSGTTGRPKGIAMPHELLVAKARALATTLAYSASDRLLHVLPLHHAHGLFMTLHCVLHAGASMLLLPRFDAEEVVRQMPQATVFSGVPTMYSRLLREAGLGLACAQARLFVSGSAPLPAQVFLDFERATGHQILECWGMSETMTNTANPLKGVRRPGTVGLPLPGVTLRAVDSEGQPVGPGVSGALEVGFSTPFARYWQRPESEQPVIRGGRLVTGDVGFLDEDGYLTLVGRTSELINTGGLKVYPKEVEAALEALPAVGRAAVFGLPHPDLGEAVAAAIEASPGAVLDAEALARELRQSLVAYKVPKAFFFERLPLSDLGKVQRTELVALHARHFLERD